VSAQPDEVASVGVPPEAVFGRLGGLLLDAGLSVTDVRGSLEDAGRASGDVGLTFSVLPQMVIVSDARTGSALVSTGAATELSQFQAARANRLSHEVGTGAVPISEAAARITEIRLMVRKHPFLGDIVGNALVSGGLAVLFRCPWWAVLTAVVAGAIVGLISRMMNRHAEAAAILPFVAALVSTVLVGGVVDAFGFGNAPLFAVCAPIAILVPGMLITNGLLELTATDIITGSARLVYGLVMLGFMAAGIIAGGALTGLRLDPKSAALVAQISGVTAVHDGWWAAVPPLWLSWIGVLVLAIGVGIALGSGPRLTALSVLAMACTYALLLFLTPAVGKSVATGIAVAILFIVSRLIARLSLAIPAAAFFQPAFLLLVPGTLGLVALAAFDGRAVETALGVFASLCIGTKVGALVADLLSAAHRIATNSPG
jgi:uncharacterized membrane protein YjjP (DUF1212 family)